MGCGLILAIVLTVGIGGVLVAQFEPRLVSLSRQMPWAKHDAEAERLVRVSFAAMHQLSSYRLQGWYSPGFLSSSQTVGTAGASPSRPDLIAERSGDTFQSEVEGVDQVVRDGTVYERLAPNMTWVMAARSEAASPQEFAALASLVRPDPASLFGSDGNLPSPSITRSETCGAEVCQVIISDISSEGQAPGTTLAELWVGSADHLIHRMEIQSTSKSTHWDFRYEFSDFNRPITLEAPTGAIRVPTVRIGQTADLREYAVTVRGVEEPAELASNLNQVVAANPKGEVPPPGYHWVVVDVIVQNKNASDLATNNYFGLRVQDDQGREYIPAYGTKPANDPVAYTGDLQFGPLAAGTTAHDLLVYALPMGSQPIRLVQRPGISGIAHIIVDLRSP